MNQNDQDPHDWLTAQFSDDDSDDENVGTDAADADAGDQAAPTSPEPTVTGSASSPVASATEPPSPESPAPETEPPATDAAPEPATPEPATTEPAAPEPAAPEPATPEPATPEPAATVASESIVSAQEAPRRASSPGSTTGPTFTWGLRPTGSPAAPVEPPAPGAGDTPPEREPDPIVPAVFSASPKAGRPTAPAAAAPAVTGSAPESSAAAAAPAPVSAARPVSAAAASVASAQPARPYYPPPPAISRPEKRDSDRLAEPAAAARPAPGPAVGPEQADAATGSAMSIAEVLDAPSPRRAAREAAAREEAARTADTRDDLMPAQAEADEPDDDGIDDLVDPHAPFTPHASAPFTPAFPGVPPEAPGEADPVRAAGAGRFDVPVVPTAEGPALAGRAQSAADREPSTKASSSRTQKVLLIVGLLLVVALAIVLIFVLGQRADAAIAAGALDAGISLAAAVGLTRFS